MLWSSSADWGTVATLASLCEGMYAAELGYVTHGGVGLGFGGLDAALATLAIATFDVVSPSQGGAALLLWPVASLEAARVADLLLQAASFEARPQARGLGVAALGAAAVRLYEGAFVSSVAEGAAYLTMGLAEPAWLGWLCSLDPALVLLELSLVAFVCYGVERVGRLVRVAQAQYDDIVTFCKQNGLSLAEVAAVLTLSVGFLVFDVFISVAEDDLTDVIGYGVLVLVGVTAAFLALAADVQFYLLVSGAGGGEATLRSVAADLVNNGLCLLRVFLCWLRYLFYDLQTELVDFAFQYTDLANEGGLSSPLFGQPKSWASCLAEADSGLQATAAFAAWLLVGVLLDLSFFLVQLLLGAFKLAIALFLLWLIVDLLLMRALAWSEARLPRRAAAQPQPWA